MNFARKLEIIRKHYKTTNAGLEKILKLSNGYISNLEQEEKEKRTINPGKLLIALSNEGISVDWFLTDKGEMFFTKKEAKHPLIEGLEALIDQQLEKIEAEIADIKSRIKKIETKNPDSGLFVSDPEPEYDTVRVCSVDNVAAGPPIPQSEDLSNYIEVPRRLIKTNPDDYYAAHIKGESMFAAGIPDGCWVLICKSDVPRNGAIQVVRCGGRSTLKRLREHEDRRWTLHFEDNTNRSIEIGPDEDYQIQGDFVAVLPED